MSGGCVQSAETCAFSHDPSNFPCKFAENCKLGADCRFSHDPSFFPCKNGENCKLGPECKFNHSQFPCPNLPSCNVSMCGFSHRLKSSVSTEKPIISVQDQSLSKPIENKTGIDTYSYHKSRESFEREQSALGAMKSKIIKQLGIDPKCSNTAHIRKKSLLPLPPIDS